MKDTLNERRAALHARMAAGPIVNAKIAARQEKDNA
jgi:hypothetical protein